MNLSRVCNSHSVPASYLSILLGFIRVGKYLQFFLLHSKFHRIQHIQSALKTGLNCYVGNTFINYLRAQGGCARLSHGSEGLWMASEKHFWFCLENWCLSQAFRDLEQPCAASLECRRSLRHGRNTLLITYGRASIQM